MNKAKVLIIYAGGTIGMVENPKTGELASLDLAFVTEQIPEFSRIPVDIQSLSIKTPIDSSEMNPDIWAELVHMIEGHHQDYDGFVILHGTDTMAYTASAFSFMIQHLRKPIILTGSQLPIGTLRTDGKENLITAIELAGMRHENGDSVIQEVCVFFQSALYRGNRSSKVSAHLFKAFSTPNYPLLAEAGVDIKIFTEHLWVGEQKELLFSKRMNTKVGLLKIYPGMNLKPYQALFDVAQHEALVIETFGAGNVFSSQTLQDFIKNYINEGGIAVNITQCSSGSVMQGKYATSKFLNDVGVVSGHNLTTEAGLTKLMYLLANHPEQVAVMFKENIAGEMY